MPHALIMFHGKAGSGKTTNMRLTQMYLAELGYTIYHIKFADPVYKLHDMIQEYMTTFGFTKVKKQRELLQLIGTEVGRKIYGEDVWAQAAMTLATNFFTERSPHYDDHRDSTKKAVIIDDLRFPEEFDAAESLSDITEVIRITLQAPESTRKERADQWPTNTTHASEVSLDEYVLDNKFDLEVHTVGSIEEDFKKIRDYINFRLCEKNPGLDEYKVAVKAFNRTIAKIAKQRKLGANFGWHYKTNGVKELRILDMSETDLPSEEKLKQAVAEVPDLIKQAEDLIVQTK